MTRLCFGGTFNPIHFGHLICARHAAERLGFSSVVLIPSANPPHKPVAADLAPADKRVRMCQLATEGRTGFEVSDLETLRTGPSFTIDTVRSLYGLGWGRVSWLIGADMVRTLPSWHEPERLMRECDFVVMGRPGWTFDWDSMPSAFRHLRELVVDTPLVQISATDIRRRVAAGMPIDLLTPDAVVNYITEAGLYRAQSADGGVHQTPA